MLNKRIKMPIGVTEELPEGIFGLLKSIPPGPRVRTKTKVREAFEAKSRVGHKISVEKIKKVQKPKKTKVMPDFNINYDKRLPSEASGITLDNVVTIPEELLKLVTSKTQANARSLSNLMLTSAATSVLSFDAASSYVRTVLDDGLGIEVDVDRGVLDVIKDLSRLDVVFFFVRRLALPMVFKRKFMQQFTEDVAKQALANMYKITKSDKMSQQLRELEGVLVKRSENKPRVHRSGSAGSVGAEEKIQAFLNSKSDLNVQAVRRSRADSPAGL